MTVAQGDGRTDSIEGVVFDPFSETFFNDPYDVYRRLRDEAPVYYNADYDFYALSRHEDVAWGQKDFEAFSSAYGIDLATVQRGKRDFSPMIIMTDPPSHRRMRSLVNRVFTPRAIMGLEPMVRETIADVLAKCDSSSFDAVHEFAEIFPAEVISRMLGVPAEDRQRLRILLETSLAREPGNPRMSKKGLDAAIEMGAYYYELIQQRRADLRDDMISDLIRAEVQRDEGDATRLDDLEIAGFLTLLGGAGAETVAKLVGNAVATFADHPDQWAALQADRGKIPAAVEELLRYEAPSQYNVRRSTRDLELHGTTIPEGAAVFMLVGSANRDERAIPDADVFDIDRDTSTGAGHIAFGYGVHSCLGAALARLEGRLALEALLDFIPTYDIDRSGLRRVAMQNTAGYSHVPVRSPR